MNEMIQEIKEDEGWNQEKLNALFKKVEPMVKNMYKRYGYSEDSFEDASQNSFEILMKSINDYDEARHMSFLMYYRNLLFYHYMQRVKKKKKDGDALTFPTYDVFVNIKEDNVVAHDSQLIREEEKKALKEAIKGLSEKQMWVIIHHFYQGKKIKEIAEEHGMHTQSVVKLKKRALDKLREKLPS
ncbi:RNA polymerase sigma factor [Alkalibacter mobilis]|uniref:RNA polymerase sigma factor n=1 Tax=Alkalibacter mobilis TaxID=2787712 RepID=UPI00189EC2EE|nr:sigma-70 family RNA polymerase sigma factor [Alkalibacter mobilis]MBF7096730.1 sigma-70 family RNA polymerase sigma factor [Alkalibacter mobilis]